MSDAAPESPKTDGKKAGLGCLGVAALVIGVPVACTVAMSLGDSGDSWTPTSREARTICEGWVSDQLKAPATARFTDGAESGAAGEYTIAGSVDSENSFGALVRSTWTCEIRYDASTEKWRGHAVVTE